MDQTRSAVIILMVYLNGCSSSGVTITNPVRYPPGDPFIGLFVGIAVPIELDHDLSLAFGFQVNYALPTADKDKELVYPPIISKRSLDRLYVYQTLEKRLERHGYSGKACLLRAICEAAQHTFEGNGVLADILHIILTPSTSREVSGREYSEAEYYGANRRHCRKYKKQCDASLIGLISVLKKSL